LDWKVAHRFISCYFKTVSFHRSCSAYLDNFPISSKRNALTAWFTRWLKDSLWLRVTFFNLKTLTTKSRV
jgi:hypothetical protein